ncbi:type II toxin-antitoxin system VapC family toxin [Actinopolyspora saharensis]|uniref:type II toxin-antitoxin system VapC family toxin n=1 Tax=Actinopolyspora saharensis TaxID=995062 RepID=UPI003F668590
MPVLDASALLALTYREDGHDHVAAQLGDDAVVSAVNWSEMLQKISAHGGDADRIGDMLRAMGLRIEPLDAEDARRAARLYPHTREAGLSLGDRACLALAARLGRVAITADRAWKNVDGLALDDDVVRIDLIRG